MKILIPAVLLGWLALSSDAQQSLLKLPDTGQTNSYTVTFGEDADYAINQPSFTNNGDGTVEDNVTGLVWQQADGGEMTWSNAFVYAQTNRVGGQSDWRLPRLPGLSAFARSKTERSRRWCCRLLPITATAAIST